MEKFVAYFAWGDVYCAECWKNKEEDFFYGHPGESFETPERLTMADVRKDKMKLHCEECGKKIE